MCARNHPIQIGLDKRLFHVNITQIKLKLACNISHKYNERRGGGRDKRLNVVNFQTLANLSRYQSRSAFTTLPVSSDFLLKIHMADTTFLPLAAMPLRTLPPLEAQRAPDWSHEPSFYCTQNSLPLGMWWALIARSDGRLVREGGCWVGAGCKGNVGCPPNSRHLVGRCRPRTCPSRLQELPVWGPSSI